VKLSEQLAALGANPLNKATKRVRMVCPDCTNRRMCTIIGKIILACDECQDERKELLKHAPSVNYCSRPHVNKLLKNGPKQWFDGEALVNRPPNAVRIMEVCFIMKAGDTIGCTADHAIAAFMSIGAHDVIGVIAKPNIQPKDPRQWMREWHELQQADKPGSLTTKIGEIHDAKRKRRRRRSPDA